MARDRPDIVLSNINKVFSVFYLYHFKIDLICNYVKFNDALPIIWFVVCRVNENTAEPTIKMFVNHVGPWSSWQDETLQRN